MRNGYIITDISDISLTKKRPKKVSQKLQFINLKNQPPPPNSNRLVMNFLTGVAYGGFLSNYKFRFKFRTLFL